MKRECEFCGEKIEDVVPSLVISYSEGSLEMGYKKGLNKYHACFCPNRDCEAKFVERLAGLDMACVVTDSYLAEEKEVKESG